MRRSLVPWSTRPPNFTTSSATVRSLAHGSPAMATGCQWMEALSDLVLGLIAKGTSDEAIPGQFDQRDRFVRNGESGRNLLSQTLPRRHQPAGTGRCAR